MIPLGSVNSRPGFAWATVHRYYEWLFIQEPDEVRQEMELWLLSEGSLFGDNQIKEFNRSLHTCMERLARRLGYGRSQVNKERATTWTKRAVSIHRLVSPKVFRCDDWVNVDRRIDIQGVLRSFPPQAARIILLRFVVGYSPTEVAKILGISVRNVNGWVTRIRKSFGAGMANWGTGRRVEGMGERSRT